MAHLGEAVARVDGKAHFVAGAMPGDVLLGEVVVDKGAWARVELLRIKDAAPERVEPPCKHFGACGGCQWQFADYAAQLRWKSEIVAGQLQHLGRIEAPIVRPTVSAGHPYAYRNRMDFRVRSGRPALFRPRSRELVPLDECLLLLPGLASLFEELGDLGDAKRITIRMSETRGERLVIVDGPVPDSLESADGIIQRTHDGARLVKGQGWIEEQIGSNRLRISGSSFFQSNTAAALVLLELVKEAAEPRKGETLLDAYAGGGLFGIALAPPEGRVVAVEASRTSIRDLRHNLSSAGIDKARIVMGRVEDTVPELDEYWQIAIVDPPRPGLGRQGVAAVTAAMPRAIAYVSCDPAGLARDSTYLREAGYVLKWAAPVDLFPQTFHIETVAKFELEPPA
jgi:23S rRNA (uracil1939-C5)-methyltransferase